MGAIMPVNPEGKTDRELILEGIRQTEQVHACLESHIASSRFRDEATEKRLGGIEGKVAVVEGTVQTLGQMFGAAQANPNTPPRVRMPWREHGKILASVLGGVTGAVILVRILAPTLSTLLDVILKVQM